MKSTYVKVGIVVAVLGVLGLSAIADAAGPKNFKETLSGYAETPVALSSDGTGDFEAKLDTNTNEIAWTLTYGNINSGITQAHIHFGAEGQSGGVSAFLCTNLGNGPAGTQVCPASGTISGTITAADVIGPAGQGIAAGEFQELVRAMQNDVTYVNIHSAAFPGGEIRAQLVHGSGGNN